MISLWWLALSLLALPLWWHRQKRQRVSAAPLATARFLPPTDPQQRRVWRWTERVLLLVRCLLLVCVIAWLAELVLPWRGDTVIITPNTDAAWAAQQISSAGFAGARQIWLGDDDAFSAIARRQGEWQAKARLLVLGQVSMPAQKPALHQQMIVREKSLPFPATVHHVAIFSERTAQWRAMFEAYGGPQRYLVGEAANQKTELIVWDLAQAPPPGLRAPLWWVGKPDAFPELKDAPSVDSIRYADSARGRLWASSAWPVQDVDSARTLFANWQRLHYPPVPYATPSQVIAAQPGAALPEQDGSALRDILAMALLALFALERILAHAQRR
jgi:hypothetical protein